MATATKSVKSRVPVRAPAKKAAPAKKTTVARPAAAKPAARPVPARAPVVPAAAPANAGAPAKPVKVEKPKKPKLVRDSFTIPKAEYLVLDDLKQRAARLAAPAKKSEILRAGIKALAAMSDVAFLACMGAVPAIKTGRPKAG